MAHSGKHSSKYIALGFGVTFAGVDPAAVPNPDLFTVTYFYFRALPQALKLTLELSRQPLVVVIQQRYPGLARLPYPHITGTADPAIGLPKVIHLRISPFLATDRCHRWSRRPPR